MGYAEFKESPKALTKAEDVGSGQIDLRHLSPALFIEIRKVALHSHTGTGSRKVNIQDLSGYFGSNGFYMYSNDGTKKYHVQLSNAGAWVITEVT